MSNLMSLAKSFVACTSKGCDAGNVTRRRCTICKKAVCIDHVKSHTENHTKEALNA